MKLKKIVVWGLGTVGVAVGGFAAYVGVMWNWSHDVPLPELTASTDPAVIERGRYLVHGPAHCVSCHVGPEEVPRVAGGDEVPLAGGLSFALGPLGIVNSPNLTPCTETGLGRFSDGQLFRMMQYAVRPDGTGTVEPMMPFGNMAIEDQVAVVSYLRSQSPVRREVPPSEWTVVGKIARTFAPTFKPRQSISPPAVAPAEAPTVERGEYLARYVANCVGCHTPRDPMTFQATGPDFSGGFEMEPAPLPGADPTTWYRTPNITPGGVLRNYPNAQSFVMRFRAGRSQPGSPMPWEPFRRMSDVDLQALYAFFQTLPPSDNDPGELTFKKEI